MNLKQNIIKYISSQGSKVDIFLWVPALQNMGAKTNIGVPKHAYLNEGGSKNLGGLSGPDRLGHLENPGANGPEPP